MLTWRWRRGFREPSVCRSLDPCVQWPPWRAPRRSEAAQNAPLVRSLLRSLPQRSAPSPRDPHTPSPPLPRPGGSLGGDGCDPGQAAAAGRASGERNPLAPRAQQPRSSRVRSQGGALGGRGCASRAHAASFPTWARRPPEPRSSSEARASSGTGRWRHHSEPSLLPGPSPVGLALPHLLQNRRRHQARSAFRRVA